MQFPQEGLIKIFVFVFVLHCYQLLPINDRRSRVFGFGRILVVF